MKSRRKKQLWYNPAEKAYQEALLEGGEALGMKIEHLTETAEGRSLLASYSRFYATFR